MGKVARWLSLRGIISPWLSPVNFWCYLKYLRLNLLQASKCANFCIKISHEILQVWSCTASFAQPSLVTSPLKDWLQDFNPVLQHFHQFFSCLYRPACIRLHPFQTPPFILGHTHHIPFVKTKSFGQRTFSFTGPTRWNSLPYGLRHSESSTFKTALKTHLFRSAY